MPYITGVTHGPKVSIIIPCWGDYKKYLTDCITGVYEQTFKNYETIIVDTETDLPTARNVGIKKAKGEYILALDVDNILKPDYLEKTLDKGDIVATHLQFFGDSNGKYTPHEPTLEDFNGGNVIDANALFKKEVWEKVGGYDESMKDGWEDYDFWVRCMRAGYKITVIPELLLLYRKHGETMSVTAGRKSEELRNYILSKQ